MQIHDEKSITIEGEPYWTVKQFSKLTGKKEATIRLLITKGNQIRKLKANLYGAKPFIKASEIFDFPFKGTGRQSTLGPRISRYILKGKRLAIVEEQIDKCQ